MSFIAKLSHINKVIYYTFIIVSFSLLYFVIKYWKYNVHSIMHNLYPD